MDRIDVVFRAEGAAGLLRRLSNLLPRDRIQPNATTDIDASGVNLYGHPTLINGVGESMRAMSCALEAALIPHSMLQAASSGFPTASDHPVYPVNVFVINADEMDLAFSTLGPDSFSSCYNIGCWMWELAEFPNAWIPNFLYVQEIWAQSRFVQQSIQAKSSVPVIWIPQVIEPGAAKAELGYQLGVSPLTFNFLFFFDFTSFIARKNPDAVIEAFLSAFPAGSLEPVALIIKINGGEKRPSEYRQFLERLRRLDPRIHLIDMVLDSHYMRGLIQACQCFVSLHRAEGFGRGLAEAMYFGKPVIGTAYSGNMDFMTAENSALVNFQLASLKVGEYPHWQGQQWAHPDVSHAAHWMRQLFDHPSLCLQLGEEAAHTIRTQHSAEAVGQRIKARLAEIKEIRSFPARRGRYQN